MTMYMYVYMYVVLSSQCVRDRVHYLLSNRNISIHVQCTCPCNMYVYVCVRHMVVHYVYMHMCREIEVGCKLGGSSKDTFVTREEVDD